MFDAFHVTGFFFFLNTLLRVFITLDFGILTVSLNWLYSPWFCNYFGLIMRLKKIFYAVIIWEQLRGSHFPREYFLINMDVIILFVQHKLWGSMMMFTKIKRCRFEENLWLYLPQGPTFFNTFVNCMFIKIYFYVLQSPIKLC